VRRNAVLAATLSAAITAGLALALCRPRSEPAVEPGPPSGFAPGERSSALSPPLAAGSAAAASSPAVPSPPASTPPAGGGELAKVYRTIPALERAAWDEIAAAFLKEGELSPQKLPRALRALALELAGTVRTAADSGPAELTHPAVLSRILEEVLERGGGRLTAAQQDELARLAEGSARRLDQVIAEAPSRPRLAGALAEVEVKLEFLERLGEVLQPGQRAMLERMTAGAGGGGGPLSPLALLEVHHVEVGADAEGFLHTYAEDLCRDLGLDPARAGAIALALRGGFVTASGGSKSALPFSRRALLAARAQAGVLEVLLHAPEIGPEGRERALQTRAILLPRAP
jgi:hypothetical protein